LTRRLVPLALLAVGALASFGLAAFPAGAAEDGLAQGVRALVAEDREKMLDAIQRLGTLGDVKALPALQALLDRTLSADAAGRVFIQDEKAGVARDALTGEEVKLAGAKLEAPSINNRVRRTLQSAIAQLSLSASDPAVRLKSAREMAQQPDPETAELVRKALEKETVAAIRDALELAMARIDLTGGDKARKLNAIREIGASGRASLQADLVPFAAVNEDGTPKETDPDIREAAVDALASIERRQFWIGSAGNVLYGLSLGSVILLAALGLAITFGLMGVINMAHGEMLMLGAYSTYVIQNMFRAYWPDHFDWYLAAALPTAFLVCAFAGMILERSILRLLYGRPLETLLATWGISLLLIQSVRMVFGAQNVEVANPGWLSGGYALFPGLVLPYNRISIVLFALGVVTLVWLLLQRTRIGLYVRAVTQNRPIAASLGVRSGLVDMWTFGLGSAVAGLGGVALSQIGNVGPELGQAYIVDSFMVVVLGGVGKLVGTVAAAMGLGMAAKFLEPVSDAVLAKIFVLAFIILFIQKRPQGLFALKGRAADA
jgi:urea transport system permease protein